MNIQKILVPVDFSEASENAFLYALEVAKAFDATVKVLHVFHIPSMMHAGAPIDEKIRMEMQREVEIKLQDFLRKHQEAAKGVQCEAKEAYGYFEQEVQEYIQEEQIKLVVLGTEGASGIKKVMGSNAWYLIDQCTCPVLSIPPVASFKGIRDIVFACDLYGSIQPTALKLLRAFSEKFNAKITIVHVQEDLTVGEAVQKKLIARLTAQLDGLAHTLEVIEGEEVNKSLRQYLDNKKPDLLFMMPRQHNMLERLFKESVTKELAFQARLPILTIKEKK